MRTKKFIALLLTCGLLLSMAGCQFSLRPAAVPWDKYEDEFRDNWQYRYLSAEEKACYGTIYTVLTDGFVKDHTVTIEDGKTNGVAVPLPHPLHNREEAGRLYNAFFRDNPQFFYVSNHYGLNGYKSETQTHYDTLLLTFTMDAARRESATRELREAAAALLKDLPQTADDFHTELALHDRLAAACTYDNAAATQREALYSQAYTAYGALVEGKAVCEGYSRAMQYLLRQVGIPCTLVTGTAKETGETHMWNMVTVNGHNYHLDVTWDDIDDRPSHVFMNLSSARLEKTHLPEEEQPGIDTCTATEADYFRRTDSYIDTYHREDIAHKVATRLLTGGDTVELLFAEEKYNNGLLFFKNATLTKDMVRAALVAAGHPEQHLWDYQLVGRPEQHTIALLRK